MAAKWYRRMEGEGGPIDRKIGAYGRNMIDRWKDMVGA